MGRVYEDLTGRTFGRLRVLGLSENKDRRERPLWRCLCVCGVYKEAGRSHLTSGTVASCGCLKGEARIIDLEGKAMDHLLVIGPMARRDNGVYWQCLCVCGVKKWIDASSLKEGKITSCGCRRGRARGAQLRTHGESYKNQTPEHRVWSKMLDRCRRETDPAYKYYGGRGITVCERWSGPEGYQHFLEDMGRRPSPGHQIERNDNDLGYCPENCRWATRMEQAANKRSNHKLTFKNETLHIAAWARRLGINSTTMRQRLKAGWSVEEALTKPAINPRKRE